MKGDTTTSGLRQRNLLQLPHVPLQTKELLPESSGIYYVLDENHNVWYIGQAENICKRWKGKTHHRFHQLEAQKKTQFRIYYELVSKDRLDEVEKQRIAKYHPRLNESPVKSKKVCPTETLLRETLVAISDFAFILGVEPPRERVADLVSKEWWGKKKLLPLHIIHISIDRNILKEKFNPSSQEEEGLIKASLNSRKTYASKWESIRSIHVYRLYINGYAIELHWWNYFYSQEKTQELRKYQDANLAGKLIKAVTPEALHQMQVETDRTGFYSRLFKRLQPYDVDFIKTYFNEPIDEDKIKNRITTVSQDYKTGKRGYGSRSKKSGTRTLSDLLQQRGIDPEKYSKKGVIRFLHGTDKIGLFVKSFGTDLKRPYKQKYRLPCADEAEDKLHEREVYNRASGFIDSQKIIEAHSWKFETLYLLASVDRQSWLLVEEYLHDFASVNRLANRVGYISQFYISPRKRLVPAKVTIKILELDSGFGIPFGPSDDFPTFETAKQEIKRRLQASNLPEMKLTFQRETVTQ